MIKNLKQKGEMEKFQFLLTKELGLKIEKNIKSGKFTEMRSIILKDVIHEGSSSILNVEANKEFGKIYKQDIFELGYFVGKL